MTKILNSFERLALSALSETLTVPAHSDNARGFGKVHLDSLCKLGLAMPTATRAGGPARQYAITDDGWLCMYGLTKQQIDGAPAGQKPVAFRIWQWPPARVKTAC